MSDIIPFFRKPTNKELKEAPAVMAEQDMWYQYTSDLEDGITRPHGWYRTKGILREREILKQLKTERHTKG